MGQKKQRDEDLASALSTLDDLRLQLDEAVAKSDEDGVRRLTEEIHELAQIVDEQFDVKVGNKAPRNSN